MIATSRRNTSQHCWPSICKLHPNDPKIWMQQIVALLGATGYTHLATILRHVAKCCELKIELVCMPRCNIVAQTCQTTTTSCNIHKCCMKILIIFKFEPTTPNMSQQLQHIITGWPNTPNNVVICCVEKLRSFGWGLIYKKTVDFVCLLHLSVKHQVLTKLMISPTESYSVVRLYHRRRKQTHS